MKRQPSKVIAYRVSNSLILFRAWVSRYDALVVAVGGLFKGASANTRGGQVVSPIFDYAQFERLEHEGRIEFGRQIGQLQKQVRKGLL
jgi:hypothetical protein